MWLPSWQTLRTVRCNGEKVLISWRALKGIWLLRSASFFIILCVRWNLSKNIFPNTSQPLALTHEIASMSASYHIIWPGQIISPSLRPFCASAAVKIHYSELATFWQRWKLLVDFEYARVITTWREREKEKERGMRLLEQKGMHKSFPSLTGTRRDPSFPLSLSRKCYTTAVGNQTVGKQNAAVCSAIAPLAGLKRKNSSSFSSRKFG